MVRETPKFVVYSFTVRVVGIDSRESGKSARARGTRKAANLNVTMERAGGRKRESKKETVKRETEGAGNSKFKVETMIDLIRAKGGGQVRKRLFLIKRLSLRGAALNGSLNVARFFLRSQPKSS